MRSTLRNTLAPKEGAAADAAAPKVRRDRGAPSALTSVVSRAAAFAFTGLALSAGLTLGGYLPTNALRPVAEALLLEKTGSSAELTGLTVRAAEAGLRVDFDRLTLAGEQDISAVDGSFLLSWQRILRGKAGADRVEAAIVEAVVKAPDTVSADGAPLSIERMLALLSGGEAGTVRLPKLDITYAASEDAPTVRLEDGRLDAAPVEGGYRVSAELPFVVGKRRTEASLEVLSLREGTTELSFTSDGAPIGPLLTLTNVDAIGLSSEVSGEVMLKVDDRGSPLGGRIDIAVEPGTGTLVDQVFEFGRNSLRATFEGAATKFRIDELHYDVAENRGHLWGTVGAESLLNPADLVLDFDVYGEGIHVDLGDFMEGPLDLDTMGATGRFDAPGRRLAFDTLRSSYFGSELKGFLALTFPEGFSSSPRLEADAVLPGPLTPEEVLAGWPLVLAFDARRWVEDNLSGGRLTNLAYTADIPMGAIGGGGLGDDTMTFTFDAADATVRYVPDMPPITHLEATATVLGNSFQVVADHGQVSGVELTRGRLDMPRFNPAGARASFTARLRGEVPTILHALEEASLVDFSEGGYPVDSFHGQGNFDLKVTWPLVAMPDPDDLKVTGTGAFARGAIDNVLPGIDATDADGEVILTPTLLTVRGSGLAAAAPADFEWTQSLRGKMKAGLSVETRLDTLAADMIGLPLRQFFRGAIDAAATANDLTPGSPLVITADLTDAAVNIAELGLSKPKGVPGYAETTVALPQPANETGEGGPIRLTGIRLTAPTFNIEGSGVFTQDGGVRRLELPRLYIEDEANLSVRLVNEEDRLELGVFGERANATGFLDGMFTGQPASRELPGRSDIDIGLQRVGLKNGVELRDLNVAGQHSGKYFDELTVTAGIGENGIVSVALDHPPGQELGFVEIEATDFGTLANGVFGIGSISGAPGSIKGTTIGDGGFRGRVEIGELIIKDAPLLARILAVTSLDGLADVLNGEGIRFQKLEGDVWLEEGRIGLQQAKLVGSALGISADGVVDLDAGTIDVRGAIAPAYALNSILGILPGIGQLFVSREGEGIVAFSYTVTGPLDQPVVTVNTLSALTPGILRRIFEPIIGASQETADRLDAAIAAAEEEGTNAASPTAPEEMQ